jgi:predicted permease
MQQIITIIAPTFFGIAVGFLFYRFSRASTKTIIDVAMYIAVPCLVFTSMLSNPIVLKDAAKLWTACLLNLGGSFVIAWIVLRFDRKKHSGLYLPIVFSNLLFIAVPILYLAYGTEGLTNAVLFYVPNGVLLYSLAIYVAAGRVGLKQGLRELVRTPLIYAVLLGLALNLAGVTLPSLVMNSVKFVGQAGTPLLLLVLGMNMGGIRISHLRLTLVASVIRMGGGFALGLLAVWLLGLTGIPRAVVIFESAMPAAFISAVACTKYENEAELVSSVVLFTTLASVAVVPALLYYLT